MPAEIAARAGAEAAVVDDRRRVRLDVGLRDPALDVDVGRQRAQRGRVLRAADRHEHPHGQLRQRGDRAAVEAREERHLGATEPKVR